MTAIWNTWKIAPVDAAYTSKLQGVEFPPPWERALLSTFWIKAPQHSSNPNKLNYDYTKVGYGLSKTEQIWI